MISHLADGVSSVVRLVAYIAALLWLSWELRLALLLVVPLFWWVSTRFARLARAVSRERAKFKPTLTPHVAPGVSEWWR
jgi:subfamily B ATP-binding cassette protein MsbA